MTQLKKLQHYAGQILNTLGEIEETPNLRDRRFRRKELGFLVIRFCEILEHFENESGRRDPDKALQRALIIYGKH